MGNKGPYYSTDTFQPTERTHSGAMWSITHVRKLRKNLTLILWMTLILQLIIEIIVMNFIKYYLCFVDQISIDTPMNYVFFPFLLRGEGLLKNCGKSGSGRVCFS